LEGIRLGGNYVAGVALGKCVEYGYEFAKEVAAYLSSKADAGAATADHESDAFFV
jgi:oxygen-dependent protoporphyrinogen oxidase